MRTLSEDECIRAEADAEAERRCHEHGDRTLAAVLAMDIAPITPDPGADATPQIILDRRKRWRELVRAHADVGWWNLACDHCGTELMWLRTTNAAQGPLRCLLGCIGCGWSGYTTRLTPGTHP